MLYRDPSSINSSVSHQAQYLWLLQMMVNTCKHIGDLMRFTGASTFDMFPAMFFFGGVWWTIENL